VDRLRQIVYSRTLTEPVTTRTRIASAFDPEEVRALKDTSSRDLLVSGPELAAQAMRAGLVDEIHLVLNPIAVGAGKSALPTDLRLDLELVDEHRFTTSGAVHVAYRVR
jgi:dihydrofolate reductase